MDNVPGDLEFIEDSRCADFSMDVKKHLSAICPFRTPAGSKYFL
jgi:hypothetical protein